MAMSREERHKLLQFMHNVTSLLDVKMPNTTYSDMERVNWSMGEEFEGTPYENQVNLQRTFFIIEALEFFRTEAIR